jgi:hypothetical protein
MSRTWIGVALVLAGGLSAWTPPAVYAQTAPVVSPGAPGSDAAQRLPSGETTKAGATAEPTDENAQTVIAGGPSCCVAGGNCFA